MVHCASVPVVVALAALGSAGSFGLRFRLRCLGFGLRCRRTIAKLGLGLVRLPGRQVELIVVPVRQAVERALECEVDKNSVAVAVHVAARGGTLRVLGVVQTVPGERRQAFPKQLHTQVDG